MYIEPPRSADRIDRDLAYWLPRLRKIKQMHLDMCGDAVYNERIAADHAAIERRVNALMSEKKALGYHTGHPVSIDPQN